MRHRTRRFIRRQVRVSRPVPPQTFDFPFAQLRSRLIAIDLRMQQMGQDPLNSLYYTDDLLGNQIEALRRQGFIRAAHQSHQGGGVFAFVTITEAGRRMMA